MNLTREAARTIDRRAADEFGLPTLILMENAGRGTAELLLTLNPERRPVLICCGKGNNGGDGLVIARHLDLQGVPVSVALFADPAELSGDAAVNYRIVTAAELPLTIKPLPSVVAAAEGWIVDALFGTGLTGPINGTLASVVAAINEAPARVLAVDSPSGLDCDTGEPLGPCVRADHTATFVAAKAGFTHENAAGFTGRVHVVGIGVPRKLLEAV